MAIIAASIAGVPEPHIGETKGVFRSHFSALIQAAANVSCIGADPGIFRYPRLDNGAPLVSK